MKTPLSTAVRGTLVALTASSLFALTACGAGQVSQTANQVPAINGVAADHKDITIRDAAIIITPENTLAVKFTASNLNKRKLDFDLRSITVNGNAVSVKGETALKPNCSLIADRQDAVEKFQQGTDNLCLSYVATSVKKMPDLYLGGHAELKITFNEDTITLNVPVMAYTPEAGRLYRSEEGLKDRDAAADEHGAHGGHGSSHDSHGSHGSQSGSHGSSSSSSHGAHTTTSSTSATSSSTSATSSTAATSSSASTSSAAH